MEVAYRNIEAARLGGTDQNVVKAVAKFSFRLCSCMHYQATSWNACIPRNQCFVGAQWIEGGRNTAHKRAAPSERDRWLMVYRRPSAAGRHRRDANSTRSSGDSSRPGVSWRRDARFGPSALVYARHARNRRRLRKESIRADHARRDRP